MASKKTKLELTWIGKDERPRLEPRILLEDKERSYHAEHRVSDDDIFDNILIKGDNLLALKALEQEYAGKVKCIYIDPPFNTGAAFENYDDGVEHSLWLSLMRDRFTILRNLLKPDGVIFVHLDDNELDYCKVIMDEIFDRVNFVNRITVDARSPSAFSTVNPGVFKASEYILWYAKERAIFQENRVRVSRRPDKAYNRWIANPEDSYNDWRFLSLKEAYLANNQVCECCEKIDQAKLERFVVENADHVFRLTAISESGAGRATIELKRQSENDPLTVFCLERESGLEPQYILNGQQISFYSKNVGLVDGEVTATALLTNVWTDIAWEGIASEGGVKFKKGKKPEKLIKRCLELATTEGDFVLDSFGGSGTTAAVAHKMKRRWIMVELGDHCYTHIIPRLKKVIDGEDQGGITKAVDWKGGGGFRFYELAKLRCCQRLETLRDPLGRI